MEYCSAHETRHFARGEHHLRVAPAIRKTCPWFLLISFLWASPSAALGERIYSLPFRLKQLDAQSSEPSGPTWFVNAWRLIKEEKCEEAWRLAWPVARRGNHDATRFIAEALLGGMQIPSPLNQSKGQNNYNILHFFAYGSLSNRVANLGMSVSTRQLMITASAIMSKLDQSAASQKVAACFATRDSPFVCLALAREAGIVRNFDDFAREFDRSTKKGFRPDCPYNRSPSRIPVP